MRGIDTTALFDNTYIYRISRGTQKLSVTERRTYRNSSCNGHINTRTHKVMEQHRRDELALQSQHLEEEERKVQQALRETFSDKFFSSTTFLCLSYVL